MKYGVHSRKITPDRRNNRKLDVERYAKRMAMHEDGE